MIRVLLRVLAPVALVAVLAACGQKGPLTLPEPTPAKPAAAP